MRIVCDQYIPFLIEAVRKEWPDVQIYPLKPDEINTCAIHDADVLVIRTRTRVDAELLAGSKVQLVCTATIGYDHIDTAYCETHGVQWSSCPGCNAQAVCDYIEEALSCIDGQTIGIVGVGHVGSLIAAMAERKGYKVLLNDPPRGIGVSLDFIAQKCDIITFHVPLDASTFHMCDEAFLARCKPNAIIINAARGGVVDEQALLHSGHSFILDTWENEPNINAKVAERALVGTMHIAGYSVEGKRNASQMCLDAIAEQFGLPKIDISAYPYHGAISKKSNEPWLAAISNQLKAAPTSFEALRKSYPLRGE